MKVSDAVPTGPALVAVRPLKVAVPDEAVAERLVPPSVHDPDEAVTDAVTMAELGVALPYWSTMFTTGCVASVPPLVAGPTGCVAIVR